MKKNSLERYLSIYLIATGVISLGAISWVLVLLLGFPSLLALTLMVLFTILYVIQANRFYKKLITPFIRLSNEIEAIALDDYSLISHSSFLHGVCAQVFNGLHQIHEQLRVKKRLFDERSLLIYSLIEHLDSPVLVLDQHNRMVHANPAFSLWHGKDWRLSRLCRAEKLGFSCDKQGKWRLDSESINADRNAVNASYQIRASRFSEVDSNHQLLLLTDISKEMRATQKKSWQQLIRVLGHEINNAITPIKSLAQSLLMELDAEKHRQVLQAIVEQSKGLSTFVHHYSNIYRDYPLNVQKFDLETLLSDLEDLFPTVDLIRDLKNTEIVADFGLFKQVIHNLIKNAQEATQVAKSGANTEKKAKIEVECWKKNGFLHISICDSGCGIQNVENLFVPFYTTKLHGQGIGLSFSRDIIEQHGGRLTLCNRLKQPGAEAKIVLPL